MDNNKLNGFNNGRDASSGIGGKPSYFEQMENKETTDNIPTAEEYLMNKYPLSYDEMSSNRSEDMVEYAKLHLTKQAEVIAEKFKNSEIDISQSILQASEEYKQSVK